MKEKSHRSGKGAALSMAWPARQSEREATPTLPEAYRGRIRNFEDQVPFFHSLRSITRESMAVRRNLYAHPSAFQGA